MKVSDCVVGRTVSVNSSEVQAIAAIHMLPEHNGNSRYALGEILVRSVATGNLYWVPAANCQELFKSAKG